MYESTTVAFWFWTIGGFIYLITDEIINFPFRTGLKELSKWTFIIALTAWFLSKTVIGDSL